MRKRPLNARDALYERQVNYFGFFPFDELDAETALAGLSETEKNILASYFFFNREVDVEDIFDYRDGLERKDPNISATAHQVLHKLVTRLDELEYGPREDLFDEGRRASWQ